MKTLTLIVMLALAAPYLQAEETLEQKLQKLEQQHQQDLARLRDTAGQPAPSRGVYKWTDAQGKVHYGDKPSAAAETIQDQADIEKTRKMENERLLRESSPALSDAAASMKSREEDRKKSERQRECDYNRRMLAIEVENLEYTDANSVARYRAGVRQWCQ